MSEPHFELVVDKHYTSPYAMSAYVALRHKGAVFSVRTLDLGLKEHRSEDYALRSMTSRVPMLAHGEFFLSESSAIAEFLEELLPPPGHAALYPADLRARARARQIQAWLRSDLMPIRTERSTDVIFVEPSVKKLSGRAAACAGQLYAVAGRLLAGDNECLFGAWCIADFDLALMLKRLVANGDEVPAALVEYVARQWDREPVQQWLQARKQ